VADQSTQGPLSLEDLLALWVSATDSTFSKPFTEAGDGGGLEVYSQGFAQHARVSQAVDRTTQALYILPFSGQTAPPAGGSLSATVTLTLRRAGFLQHPLVLGAGLVVVDEVAVDSGEDGPVGVDTGRRYVLSETVVFFPGEVGPLDVVAAAEKPGSGYDNPAPGTISAVEQVGAGFNNALATVLVDAGQPLTSVAIPASRTRLRAANVADMFVPQHVGAYAYFADGANAGRTGRMTFFAPPDPAHGAGSAVDVEQLAATLSFTGDHAGTFLAGEVVDVLASAVLVGRCSLLAAREDGAGDLRAALVAVQGRGPVAGDDLLGGVSGAAAHVDVLLTSGDYAAEAPSGGVGGASWRVLDWAADWKLTAANALSPSGGRLGMLDALGAERNLPRQPDEDDEDYRERVAQVADVVTPNAVRRALNRSAGDVGWCLREVGSARLPGLYCDRTDAVGDFYDTEVISFNGFGFGTFQFEEPVEYRTSTGIVNGRGYWASYRDGSGAAQPAPGAGITVARPRGPFPPLAGGEVIVGLQSGATFLVVSPGLDNRLSSAFHVWLDYVDFRAFFLVGLPNVDFGDFGCAYDAGMSDAYDCAPHLAFFDGFPAGAASFYRRVFAAVDKVRAYGVSFGLYQTRGEPCT